MCGIFGAIGKYDKNTLKLLALLNQSRGKDSCGFYNGEHVLKSVGFVKEVINNEFLGKNYSFMLGHTRLATRGAVSERNAHPFTFGKITGTHNGQVSNFDELMRLYPAHGLEVDSEIIFWGLNKHGIEFLKQIQAYWGLAWHDRRDKEAIFLSMHSHELAIAQTKSALYYSSDKNDLKRAGLTPISLKEDFLYRIDIKTLKITKQILRGLKPRSYARSSYGSTGYQDWSKKTSFKPDGTYALQCANRFGDYRSNFGANDINAGALLTLPERPAVRPYTQKAINEFEKQEIVRLKELIDENKATDRHKKRYARLVEKLNISEMAEEVRILC